MVREQRNHRESSRVDQNMPQTKVLVHRNKDTEIRQFNSPSNSQTYSTEKFLCWLTMDVVVSMHLNTNDVEGACKDTVYLLVITSTRVGDQHSYGHFALITLIDNLSENVA